MAYSNRQTRSNKKSHDLDKHMRLQKPLSSDRQVVKIGDDSTGLLLKDKDVLVEGDATIGGDLTVQGEVQSATVYAGTILGYTRIQNDSTTSAQANITVDSSSMTVFQTAQGTDVGVNFIAPPSGKVEIQCSFWMIATSDGAKFSLSTHSSYAELDETHTYDGDQTIFIDETDHNYNTVSFSVTGLTAGTNTTYYLAGLASGANVTISHGRNRVSGTHYPPITIKAIALPATIVTGE